MLRCLVNNTAMEQQMLTAQIVRTLLSYQPETGQMVWLERSDTHDAARWNARYAGKPAFTALKSTGYKCGKIFRKTYLAHRVAWLISKGEWPENELDHINGDRSDNRLCNLRSVETCENRKNAGKNKNNRSGFTGVSWDKTREMWKADVWVNRKNINLGRFKTIDEAIVARLAANEKYKFHKNHGSERKLYD